MGLEIYTRVKTYKECQNKSIYLVVNELDGLYYIERDIHKDNINTYKAIQKLQSPYFPKIYEIIQEKDKMIIIEEYINYPTLDAYMLNNKLDEKTVIKIMIELCDSLDLLHQYNIIHRDIKPENIFYGKDHIILFDFDIARIHCEQKKQDTTILGSVGYAAPEQFGFQQSDQRTDIYALGVLMNVLLTNKLPNEQLYTGYSQSVIEKAIQIDPNKRYPNVKAMKHALKYVFHADWTIPGFRENKLTHKIIAVLGYTLLIWASFGSNELSSKTWSITNIYLSCFVLIFFLTIVSFITNYKNCHELCFYNKSSNKIVRIVGIVLSLFLVLFIEIFICSIVGGLFGLFD